MNTTFTKKIIFILFLLFSVNVNGNPVLISDAQESYRVGGLYLWIMEDTSNRVAIYDIQKNKIPFKNNTDPYLSLPNYKSSYWIKFNIVNNSTGKKNWLLELQDYKIDYYEVFLIKDSSIIDHYKGGDSFPFQNKNYRHKNFVHDLNLAAGDSLTCYLLIRPSRVTWATIMIRSANNMIEYSIFEYFFLAVFYGFLLALGVYNLFLFFALKDSSYLLYMVYVATVIFFSTDYDGFYFQILWPSYPSFNNIFTDLGIHRMLLIIAAAVFAGKFLNLKNIKTTPSLLLISAVIARLVFIFMEYNFNFIGRFSNAFDFICFLFIFFAGIYSYRSGFLSARYYIVAFSFLIIAFFVVILNNFSFIPNTIFSYFATHFGFLAESLFLSIALSDKVRQIRIDKELAQEKIIDQLKENERIKDEMNLELENKVIERTKDLDTKNGELKNANLILKEQAEAIEKINKILESENKDLLINISELEKARIMFKEVDFEAFQKVYPDPDSCYKYLASLKWQNEYACIKCNHKEYFNGSTSYSRRCKKCRYEESVTAYTIFHNSKIEITKAFYMVYLISTSKKDITSEELSRKLSMRQKTCWSFKKKIVTAINNSPGKISSENWGSLFFTYEK
jgi:hypothetical protein